MGIMYQALLQEIESLAPPWLQSSWDHSGLQVASDRKEIEKVAVCLDATPLLVEKALDENCDFILAHHPLALKAEFPDRLNNYRKILKMLLCADVALYSAHTSLDVNINGPAGFLGRTLKLTNTCVLDPVYNPEGADAIGFGQVGNLPEPVSFSRFANLIMDILSLDVLPVCGFKKKDIIRRVAYCGGSGSSLLKKAEASEADVFITGDIKYHTALETEICILDVGHYSLEAEMMRHVTRSLQDKFESLEISYLASPDPFSYIYKI